MLYMNIIMFSGKCKHLNDLEAVDKLPYLFGIRESYGPTDQ